MFSEDEKKILEIVGQASSTLKTELKSHFECQQQLRLKKQKKREKFFSGSTRTKWGQKNSRPKLQFVALTLAQTLKGDVPFKEPGQKQTIAREEPLPYLFEVEERFGELEYYQAPTDKKKGRTRSKVIIEELELDKLDFIPHRLYLQRLDNDHRKMLVKMYVDWGYLNQDRMPLFIDPTKGLIANCKIHLVDKTNRSLGLFPLHHSSKYFIDTEKAAYPLFIGQMTGLNPATKYKYRVECYAKETGELFAGTKFHSFQTGFNLVEKDKPFFFSVASDLHGGRKGRFLRGKVKGLSLIHISEPTRPY